MTSSTVKFRVGRRVSRISKMVGKSAKTELKNELKRVALLSTFRFWYQTIEGTKTLRIQAERVFHIRHKIGSFLL